jgi:CheY-like chemotaxis protein
MSTSAPTTVMIVEGDPHLRVLMQRYAGRSGCRAAAVGSGEAALEMARQERPAAIVPGTDLPRMSGRDVLREPQEDGATRDIPIVLCSWPEEAEAALAADAAGYPPTPVQYGDFVAALASAGLARGNGEQHDHRRGFR